MSKWLFFCSLLLCGCGYHSAPFAPCGETSVMVSTIKGDEQGRLGAHLARALTQATRWEYVERGGMYVLDVAIKEDGEERIGYRYDRDPVSGKRRSNVLGVENRRALAVEVQLKDAQTEQILLGPYVVRKTIDSDYVESNSIRDLAFIQKDGEATTVLDFSLGQLDSFEGAHDDTTKRLYESIAQQIAEDIARKQITLASCRLQK